MTTNSILAIAMLIGMAVVGLYDVYAYSFLPPGNSVSYVLQAWSRTYPMLPFFFGLLAGHLFWPISRD